MTRAGKIALDDPAARADALRSGQVSAATRAVLEECDVELDDRYVLERPLGDGATSTVHAGYDLLLERDVAVKIVRRDHDDVLREAASTATISHANVVRILDVRVGEPSYIVMELLSEGGVAARSAAVDAPRDLREALRWVRDAARGIAAAHTAGVWHGDLKPGNLLVLPVSRQARVIDFGMASSAGRAQIGGTPELMAPEMLAAMLRERDAEADAAPDAAPDLAPDLAPNAAPDAGPGAAPDLAIDLTRIDAFGLGALAYALLTGRVPRPTSADALAAARAGASSPAEQHARELVRLREARRAQPAFEAALATRWKRPLGARLAAVLAPTLAVDPDARPDAAALADELDHYLANEPTRGERRRFALRAALWCRRYPAAVAFAAGVAAVVAIAIVAAFAWDQLRAVQREEATAEGKLAATRADLEHARADRDALQRDLAANRARDTQLLGQIDELSKKEASDSGAVATLRGTLATAGQTVARLEAEATALGERIDTDASALVARDGEIAQLHADRAAADEAHAAALAGKDAALAAKDVALAAKAREMADAVAAKDAALAAKAHELADAVAAKDAALAAKAHELADALAAKDAALAAKDAALAAKARELAAALAARDAALAAKLVPPAAGSAATAGSGAGSGSAH